MGKGGEVGRRAQKRIRRGEGSIGDAGEGGEGVIGGAPKPTKAAEGDFVRVLIGLFWAACITRGYVFSLPGFYRLSPGLGSLLPPFPFSILVTMLLTICTFLYPAFITPSPSLKYKPFFIKYSEVQRATRAIWRDVFV